MTISISSLTENDAIKMAHIASNSQAYPMTANAINSCFGRFYSSYGLYQNSELLAFVILHQLFEDATVIEICVDLPYQGKGYGQQLLEFAIANLKQTQAENLALEVRESNIKAIGLYKKLGFIKTGTRANYYKTENAVLMSLALK